MKNTFNIQLPFFPGFYCTDYEPNEDSEVEDEISYYLEEFGVELEYDDFTFNNEKYEHDAANVFAENLQGESGGLIVNIDNVVIDSPRYYNFRNDELFANVTLCDDWKERMIKFINDEMADLSGEIKEDWTSYDGFLSYMSTDINDWIKELQKDEPDERYISCMIDYMISHENKDIIDDLMYDTIENIYLNEYLSFSETGQAKMDAHYEETHQPGWDMTNQMEIEFPSDKN